MRFSIAMAAGPLVSSPAFSDSSPALQAGIERGITGRDMFLANGATHTMLDSLYPDVSGGVWCGECQT